MGVISTIARHAHRKTWMTPGLCVSEALHPQAQLGHHCGMGIEDEREEATTVAPKPAATWTWCAGFLCVADGDTNKPAQVSATPLVVPSEEGDLEMVRLLCKVRREGRSRQFYVRFEEDALCLRTTVLLKILLAIGCRSITTAERQTGNVMDSDVATHTVPVHQDRSMRVIVIDSGQAVSYSGRTRSIVRIVPIPAS